MRPMEWLRRALPFIGVALLAAIVYDVWIFYSRWHSSREAVEERQAAQAERDRESIKLLGGTSFRIINFYAAPQVIPRGTPTKLCFGVYGAKQLRIEPDVGDVHPAYSDCLEVAPKKDTRYKLTADDGAGHTLTAGVSVKVNQAGSMR